jgi:hypothetical protein
MPDQGADPRVSSGLMLATYVVGAVGIAVGFATLNSDPPSLSLACLLAVGGGGLLSFIRHSIFHRSDAARMGWDLGQRNNFQIEVGLANLAWGTVGIASVVMAWGLRAQAATFLTFGVYLLGVAAMQVVSPGGPRRSIGPLLGLASFGLMLCVLGVLGMRAG